MAWLVIVKLSRMTTRSRHDAGAGRAPSRAIAAKVTTAAAAFVTSADALDDPDELLGAVAVPAGEAHEVLRARHDGAALGAAGDGDAAAAAKLEQPLVAQQAKRAQDGVRVDFE